jgi:hypothetical protein
MRVENVTGAKSFENEGFRPRAFSKKLGRLFSNTPRGEK